MKKQILLQQEIQAKAKINIITCCKCGAINLYRLAYDTIKCHTCLEVIEVEDCEDYFYEGMSEN